MEKLESIIDSNIRIIDMKALLKRVARKWWVILICACVMCAIALIRTGKSGGESTDEEKIREYTEKVDEYQLTVDSLQDYVDHSFYFEIDPMSISTMQYVLDFSGLTNQNELQNRYYEYLLNDIDYRSYRNDMDDKYIREQTGIEMMEDTAAIKVSVTGRDEEDAVGLMDYIISSAQKNFAGDQSPAMLGNDDPVTVSKPELIQLKTNVTTALNNANTSLQTAKNDLMKLENDTRAIRINAKSLILFGLIGIAAAVLALMIVNVFKGTVLSDEELRQQYLLPDLGNKENISLIAEQIGKRIGDKTKVILVSDLKQIDLGGIAMSVYESGLSVPVLVCAPGQIEADENTLAIVAVRPGQSAYKEINRLMRDILSKKGEIAGTIIC